MNTTIRHPFISLCLAVAAAAVAAGCGSSMKRTNSLLDDVNAYNDGVRWRQYPKAAARIHPKDRSEFVAGLVSFEEDVRISDWEIIHIQHGGDSSETAEVVVRYHWFLDSKGLLHQTSTLQTWTLHGKRWLVTAEKHLRGERMPWISEPVQEDSESGAPHAGLGAREMMVEFR